MLLNLLEYRDDRRRLRAVPFDWKPRDPRNPNRAA